MNDKKPDSRYTGILAGVPVDDAPEDDRIVAQTIREAQIVKVEDGVEYDPESLKTQKWIESRFDSPATLYDENVDHTYWQGLAAHMKSIIKRTTSPWLRECREAGWRYAKVLQRERVILSPFRSQLELNDLLTQAMCANVRTKQEFMEAKGRIDETLRFWRESNYVYFNERFMGRQVG